MSEPRTRVEPLNGVELALQTFERIAAAGRCVVRYDLRDTGQSTSYGAGAAR
jgi:hypothetical protein